MLFFNFFLLFDGSLEGNSKNKVHPIAHAAALESYPKSYFLPTTSTFFNRKLGVAIGPL